METKALLLGTIVTTISVLLGISLVSNHASAQQNTSASIGTNFTKLLAENKEFQSCFGGTCVPAVDVVYQGLLMLVLKSDYIDIIWKAVELAKKEGYKIDGMSTYATGTETKTVNVLVAMSKG